MSFLCQKISYIQCSLFYSCKKGLFQIHRDEILADFPPELRISIGSELGIVIKILDGGTKKKSELRTICNRRIHFLWYCKQRNLLDRIFSLDSDKKRFIAPPTTVMLNFAMACYAVFLATGHSLRCRSIRSDTIKIYLHNAATFVSRFDAKDRDARKKEGETKLCPAVAAVIGIVKRYEDMKNRREPFTLGMLHLLLSKVYFFSDDSSKAALADWFTIGLHGGYRRAKWCQ